MESKKFSNNMLVRIPAYLNYLKGLPQSTQNISATKIACALGLGEVSVRKDLAKISNGGRCKLGYSCEELINDIEKFLGLESTLTAVIVGDRNLIQSFMVYEGFEAAGLKIAAGFDLFEDKKSRSTDDYIYPIEHLEHFCMEKQVQIGILMTPTEHAQEMCDHMISARIKGIWNFTPVHLNVPEHIVLQNESFLASVTKLRMQMEAKNAMELN